MQIITLYALKAEPGMVLHKGDVYASSVYLKEGESPDDWEEIPEGDVPEDFRI